jgi:hypothetical protein
MSSRRIGGCIVLAALAGCGNYSNEDLDFQLALPEQGDIEAKMQLSVMRSDSAEYYRYTRSAIANFNGMVDKLTGLIDVVRGTVPTSRHGNQRIWGPWPAENQPGWQVRVLMLKTAVSETQLRIDYNVQVRPQGADDSAWVDFLTGYFASEGSARTGQGEIHLLVEKVRDAGFPVNQDPGLVELVRVDIAYKNTSFPIAVSLYIENVAGAKDRTMKMDYLQNQDGSGYLTFDWEGRADNGATVTAQMASRWIGSGAGRADLTADLTPLRTGVITLLGIDCWGTDTIATYSYRRGVDDPLKPGQETCLFQ